MPDLRFNPGDVVRIAGNYALVNRYGKSLDVAMWREVGERLPITVAAEGPPKYVLVGLMPAQAA